MPVFIPAGPPGRGRPLEPRHRAGHGARTQVAALEAVVDGQPHQGARLVQDLRLVQQLAARQRQQRAAAERDRGRRPVLAVQPVARIEAIACRDVDRLAAARVDVELQSKAEHVQQPLLEAPQHGSAATAAASSQQRVLVELEQRRLRIVLRRQLQQQFIQVAAADPAARRGRRQQRPVGLGAGQLRRIAASMPGQQQRLEGLQSGKAAGAAALRPLAARAAREGGQAAMVAREHLEDPAGVAPGTLVQHVAGRSCTRSAPRSFQAQLRQRLRIVGPVLAHLHPQVQVQRSPSSALSSRRAARADALQALAAGADHDGLLALAVDPDDGMRPRAGRPPSLDGLDFHGDAVGQLLVQLQRQLLADDLGDAEALAAVGDLLGRKQRRRLRQVPQRCACIRRCMSSLSAPTPAPSRRTRAALASARDERQQPVARVHLVDLVDDCDRRPAAVARRASSAMWSSSAKAQRLDHQQRPGRHPRGARRRCGSWRGSARASAPWCSPGVSTKAICASGRLTRPSTRWRVVCGRGVTMDSFWPDQRIQQRRLADIRPADQRREPAAELAHRAVTCSSSRNCRCRFLFGASPARCRSPVA